MGRFQPLGRSTKSFSSCCLVVLLVFVYHEVWDQDASFFAAYKDRIGSNGNYVVMRNKQHRGLDADTTVSEKRGFLSAL